jgi:hypothetical protein
VIFGDTLDNPPAPPPSHVLFEWPLLLSLKFFRLKKILEP